MDFAAGFPDVELIRSLGEPITWRRLDGTEEETFAAIDEGIDLGLNYGQVTSSTIVATVAVAPIGDIEIGAAIVRGNGSTIIVDGIVSNDGGAAAVYCR